jgi:hypothetical protein
MIKALDGVPMMDITQEFRASSACPSWATWAPRSSDWSCFPLAGNAEGIVSTSRSRLPVLPLRADRLRQVEAIV